LLRCSSWQLLGSSCFWSSRRPTGIASKSIWMGKFTENGNVYLL
jgi:hypothetical protein